MHESNFYEFINIHYGVKSKTEENLNEKVHRRKKQIIEYEIELQNKYIRNLHRAENESDLEKFEKEYNENLQTVKKR